MSKAAWMLVATMVLPAVAAAQSVEGIWRGSTTNGTLLQLELRLEGDRVTGWLTRGDEVTPLENGRLEGKLVRFTVSMGGRTASFTAELRGEQLVGYNDAAGPETATAFARVK